LAGTGTSTGDDRDWRTPSAPPRPDAPPPYTGPPPTTPPPPGWRTPVVVNPPTPRSLPTQDSAALDAQERSARTITYGIAMIAGAVLLVLILVLCGQALL